MKKKYKAMGAMSLALTTAFISVNGVGVLKGNATTVGATYVDMTGIQNNGGLHSSNAGYVETSAGIDESNYGEWIIEREPTYEQDGLRKREYVASDGTFYVQYETIPRLIVPPVPSDPIPEQIREREQGLQYRKETLPQNPMQVNLLDIHREKRKKLKIRKVQKKVQKTLKAAMTIRTPRTRQIMRRQPKALRKRLKMQSSREINQVINIKEMIMTV